METGIPLQLSRSNLREKLHSMASHIKFGRIILQKKKKKRKKRRIMSTDPAIDLTCIFTRMIIEISSSITFITMI